MKRWLDRLIVLSALSFLVLGTALALMDTVLRTDHADPRARCGNAAQSFTSRCYADIPVTVIDAQLSVDRGGLPRPTVTIRPDTGGIGAATLDMAPSTSGDSRLHIGARALVKIYDGVPVGLQSGGANLPTALDPNIPNPLRRGGGISLMGLSALILLVRPPAAGTSRERFRVGGYGLAEGAVARILRDRALGAALAAFAVLQLLDIVTTFEGARAGLLEGNPVAGEIASRLGFLTGYIAMKGAVVIAMLLAAARLPRRAALLVGWTGATIMALVVVHNSYLIAG